jgi:hypothetical protein
VVREDTNQGLEDGIQCDTRPESQCSFFNSSPLYNLEYDYKWSWIPFATNVSESTARLVERSLTGTYILRSGGGLPPKHKLPCFKKVEDWTDDVEAILERIRRVEEYFEQMKNLYGTN